MYICHQIIKQHCRVDKILTDKNNINETSFDEKEALKFHSEGRPGKIEINATKPMATQKDLALA